MYLGSLGHHPWWPAYLWNALFSFLHICVSYVYSWIYLPVHGLTVISLLSLQIREPNSCLDFVSFLLLTMSLNVIRASKQLDLGSKISCRTVHQPSGHQASFHPSLPLMSLAKSLHIRPLLLMFRTLWGLNMFLSIMGLCLGEHVLRRNPCIPRLAWFFPMPSLFPFLKIMLKLFIYFDFSFTCGFHLTQMSDYIWNMFYNESVQKYVFDIFSPKLIYISLFPNHCTSSIFNSFIECSRI